MIFLAVAAIIIMTGPTRRVLVLTSSTSSIAISVSVPTLPLPVFSSMTPGLVAFAVAFPIAVTVAVPMFAVAFAVARKVVAISTVTFCERVEGKGVVSTCYASTVEVGQ